MSENELQASIVSSLERLGHHVTRIQSGKVRVKGGWMQLAEEGTPDLVVRSPGGLTTWLETKVKDGRLRPAQLAWHERAKKGGHRVAIVRSINDAVTVVGSTTNLLSLWER